MPAKVLPSSLKPTPASRPTSREGAVSVVVIEETLHRIVGDENIGETIAIVVRERDAQSLAIGIGDSGLLRKRR